MFGDCLCGAVGSTVGRDGSAIGLALGGEDPQLLGPIRFRPVTADGLEDDGGDQDGDGTNGNFDRVTLPTHHSPRRPAAGILDKAGG